MLHSQMMWRAISAMAIRLSWCVSILSAISPARAQDFALFEAMRDADMRLASMGSRLSIAAAPLCERLEPDLGLQLHSLSQYSIEARNAAREHFRFMTSIAVEGVIANGAGARAGIRRDDSVVSIGGIAVPGETSPKPSTSLLVEFLAEVANLSPDATLRIVVKREGRELTFMVTPVPACRTRYELRISGSFDAKANGDLVQITSRYFEAVDPDLLPALVAHELSHNILRHRERLSAVGATFGFASGFGRNAGLFRQTEIEADILAIHLLAGAGYDPAIAARFWRHAGPRIMAGMIRSRSHPPLRDRIAIAEFEAAKFALRGSNPEIPAFVAERNRPLDADWRKLLPPTAGR